MQDEAQVIEPAYLDIKQKRLRNRGSSHPRSRTSKSPSSDDDSDEPPHERFYRRPAVKKRYGNLSDSSLFRWIQQGIFPAAEKLGPNYSAWRGSILDEYDADPQGWAAKHGKKET